MSKSTHVYSVTCANLLSSSSSPSAGGGAVRGLLDEDDGLGLDGRRNLQFALLPLLVERPLQPRLLLPRREPLARRPLEVHPDAARGRGALRLDLGAAAAEAKFCGIIATWFVSN